jgi:molybdopterin synthase sulfur carrier subunit
MAKVKITFYGALARAIKEKEAELEASNIKEAINKLERKYGGDFRQKIQDDIGNLRRFINIFVNGKDIRFLDLLNTPLKEGDEVSIIPAVSGG